jgi:hypothetical protein
LENLENFWVALEKIIPGWQILAKFRKEVHPDVTAGFIVQHLQCCSAA